LTRLVRDPDLLLYWRGDLLQVELLQGKRRHAVSPEVVRVLDFFGAPRSPAEAARALTGYEPASVLRSVARMVRAGLLIPEAEARRRPSLAKGWKGNTASAHYHVASRDGRYLKSPMAIDRFLRARVKQVPRPSAFKTYRGRKLQRLSGSDLGSSIGELGRALDARRTVRSFSRKSVELADLEILVRGTWGLTGWLDGGPLGSLALKRSPSAGALHPIECYVLAWKVRGLTPGLYHYDVAADGLRLLRRGDFREAAVKAASGQRWVGQAAFACVMTAMFSRTLWKYEDEAAFKVLWLDAGHLAQTFCLLATSRGLGPFTTAAIQDTYIEKTIGLDGVSEFPVYLCGAGVPARQGASPRARRTAK
jgi:SagB-type dehydrogenase family enzyme